MDVDSAVTSDAGTFRRRFFSSSRVRNALSTNVLSSLGNLTISLAIAHLAGIAELGRFAVAFAVYLLATGIARSAIAEPLSATLPKTSAVLDGSRLTSILGLGFLVLTIGVGLILGSDYMMLVGMAMHGSILYDYVKTTNMVLGDGKTAVIQESIWTLLTLLGVACVVFLGMPPIIAFAVWTGANCSLGYLFSVMNSYKILPRWNRAIVQRRIAASFGGDYLLGSGMAQITIMLLAPLIGIGAVGAIRGAGTLFGPVTLVVNTARSMLIPFLSRVGISVSDPLRKSYMTGLVLTMLVVPVALVVCILPDHLGETILGINWYYAEPLLPFLAIELVFTVVATVPFAGHRSLHAGGRTLTIRGATAPVRVVTVLGLGYFLGVGGAVIGMAVMSVLSSLVWWWSYRSLIIGKSAVR